MKINKLNVVMLALLSTFGLSASAQSTHNSPNYNPSWYGTVEAAGRDAYTGFLPPDGGSSKGADKNAFGGGLGIGRPLSRDWDVLFDGDFLRANHEGSNYKQYALGANALYFFSRSAWQPYLRFGGGVEHNKTSFDGGSNAATSPYLSAGPGIRYAFNDRWSADAHIVAAHTFLHNSNFKWGDNGAANTYKVGIGLVYAFGAAPAVLAPVAAAVAAPYVAPVVAPPAPRFEKITLSASSLFAFDSYKLRQPQPDLDKFARVLSSNQQGGQVAITGYTDRLGSDAYNQKLSQHRAETVKAYLVSQGVSAASLVTVGKGKADPVVQCNEKNKTALITCLEPNRRVEMQDITFEKQVH